MNKTYNVTLSSSASKEDFLSGVLTETCSCTDMCDSIPDTLVLSLDEANAQQLANHSDVQFITEEPEPFSPDLPVFFSKNKTYTGVVPLLTENGSDYSSLQFYFHNNQLSSGSNLGTHPDDTTNSISGRYASFWTGEHVDIVTLEVNDGLDYTGYHDTHLDYDSIDNPGTSRVIPMDWPNSSGPNLQIASNNVLSKHAIGVTSACAGTVCGFAKKASIRAFYVTSVVANVNSIIQWHNGKPTNPLTGFKNPTILITEFQYLYGNRTGVRIENVSSFTHNGVTTARPGGGWGTDFTPFVNANIIPKRIKDPDTSDWHWCIVAPIQSEFTQLKTALNSAWDAGITIVTAPGNDGVVYCKDSDSSYDSYITVESGGIIYNITRGSNSIAQVTKSTQASAEDLFLFRAYGPNGLDKAVDVAAIQGSDAHPIIEAYSVRGTGIDICGLGAKAWTAYPIDTLADGFDWGMFSGTSCSAPVAAGIAACLMEKFFYYYNRWPTPSEIKSILVEFSKKDFLTDGSTTDWSDVPLASSDITQTDFADGGDLMLEIEHNITSLNGAIRFREFADTPNRLSFIDNNILRVFNTTVDRPAGGLVYPRVTIKK